MIKKWRKVEWPHTWEWLKGKKYFVVKPIREKDRRIYRLPKGFKYAIYKVGAGKDGYAKRVGYAKLLRSAQKRADKLEHSGNA